MKKAFQIFQISADYEWQQRSEVWSALQTDRKTRFTGSRLRHSDCQTVSRGETRRTPWTPELKNRNFCTETNSYATGSSTDWQRRRALKLLLLYFFFLFNKSTNNSVDFVPSVWFVQLEVALTLFETIIQLEIMEQNETLEKSSRGQRLTHNAQRPGTNNGLWGRGGGGRGAALAALFGLDWGQSRATASQRLEENNRFIWQLFVSLNRKISLPG